MKNGSKYFDQIRVNKSQPGKPKAEAPVCQWKGCEGKGQHKAPRGRGHEGQYFMFCAEHIRHYNANYNYFQGMSDNEVADFQKDALTGHRPTWKAGANAWSHGTGPGNGKAGAPAAAKPNDPHGFFAYRAKRQAKEDEAPRRYVKPIERKSLETLHLGENATPEEIKAKFKALVKVHHPDANGGDKRSEDTLREIIQAYNYLKQVGLA